MSEADSLDAGALAGEIAAAVRALGRAPTADVRALRRAFTRRVAKAPAREVVRVGFRLLEMPGPWRRFVAYELVCHHRGALASLRARELKRFGRGIDSWDSTDIFALYLAGPVWRAGQVRDSLIHGWARSRDVWWRRASLVSTVPLNSKSRGGRGDAARTLRVCRMLLADREEMVVKALSWALRELAKRDPRAVRRFLEAHQGSLAARVRREVRNKLTTGLKNPRGH